MEKALFAAKRRRRVKLIFNPKSGKAKDSPDLLAELIGALQASRFIPEVFLLEEDSDLDAMAREAASRGITMFLACGGDGTVSAVCRAIFGLRATLGVIPAGIQNNIAASLGIPVDVPAAIALLRAGKRTKIDLAALSCGEHRTLFAELCTVGLASAVFPAADGIQHGQLGKIGDFIQTLVSSAPSEIRLFLDDKKDIESAGHAVLVSNMSYVGRHYRVGSLRSFKDGFLDVLFLGDLSKLNLIGYAVKNTDLGEIDDPNLWSFKAKKVAIRTAPDMPVMADGRMLGEGDVTIELMRKALGVMAPPQTRKVVTQ